MCGSCYTVGAPKRGGITGGLAVLLLLSFIVVGMFVPRFMLPMYTVGGLVGLVLIGVVASAASGRSCLKCGSKDLVPRGTPRALEIGQKAQAVVALAPAAAPVTKEWKCPSCAHVGEPVMVGVPPTGRRAGGILFALGGMVLGAVLSVPLIGLVMLGVGAVVAVVPGGDTLVTCAKCTRVMGQPKH